MQAIGAPNLHIYAMAAIPSKVVSLPLSGNVLSIEPHAASPTIASNLNTSVSASETSLPAHLDAALRLNATHAKDENKVEENIGSLFLAAAMQASAVAAHETAGSDLTQDGREEGSKQHLAIPHPKDVSKVEGIAATEEGAIEAKPRPLELNIDADQVFTAVKPSEHSIVAIKIR
jgi:hypothetical protein